SMGPFLVTTPSPTLATYQLQMAPAPTQQMPTTPETPTMSIEQQQQLQQ
ncbi:unnamed protein product, partial [Rotaria magnacalcarata]